MTFKYNKDLPHIVQNHLPEQAQDIFREAYNQALEEYKNEKKIKKNETLEEVAYKNAWAAVKEKYIQKNQKWVAIKHLKD